MDNPNCRRINPFRKGKALEPLDAHAHTFAATKALSSMATIAQFRRRFNFIIAICCRRTRPQRTCTPSTFGTCIGPTRAHRSGAPAVGILCQTPLRTSATLARTPQIFDADPAQDHSTGLIPRSVTESISPKMRRIPGQSSGSPDWIRGGLPWCRKWCRCRWLPGDERKFRPTKRVARPDSRRTFWVEVLVWTPNFRGMDTA